MEEDMIDRVEKENIPQDFKEDGLPFEKLSAKPISPYLLPERREHARILKRRDRLAKKWRRKELKRLGNGFSQ